MTRCIAIGVSPESEFSTRTRLWSALESVYPVVFRGCAASEPNGLRALITMGECEGTPERGIALLRARHPEAVDHAPGMVHLSEAECLDSRLRGAHLRDSRCASGKPVRLDGEVLASVDGVPVWTAGKADWRHSVAVLPEELAPDEVLRDRFRATRFLGLLPILELLRHVSAELAWGAPPLRASFILDDPNLHWPSYGFADFAALATAGEERNFHTAIATVPLDAWFAHPRAVRLFGEHASLSLLTHGNDHVWCELDQELPERELLQLAAQAQRRISRLERYSGLRVARVMAPPHGRISEPMLRALRRTGFTAACISRPFPWLERPPPYAVGAQWQMSDLRAGCVPVIPRYPLDGDAEDIVMRAYLDQPLILYGHHGDLSEGLEGLAEHAVRINALGGVRWQSLRGIAESNYQHRRDGELIRVRLFTRHARLSLEHSGERLTVHHGEPTDGGDAAERLEVRQPGLAPYLAPLGREFALQAPGAIVDLRLIASDALDPRSVPAPRRRLWSPLRRLLVEGRDRLQPLSPIGRSRIENGGD